MENAAPLWSATAEAVLAEEQSRAVAQATSVFPRALVRENKSLLRGLEFLWADMMAMVESDADLDIAKERETRAAVELLAAQTTTQIRERVVKNRSEIVAKKMMEEWSLEDALKKFERLKPGLEAVQCLATGFPAHLRSMYLRYANLFLHGQKEQVHSSPNWQKDKEEFFRMKRAFGMRVYRIGEHLKLLVFQGWKVMNDFG